MYIGKNWYTEPEIKSLVKKLEAENAELKKLLRSIRSYYRENIAWVDLFEEDAQKLMGGSQNGT